jgi:L-amino acid N-acyltransferase YncA
LESSAPSPTSYPKSVDLAGEEIQLRLMEPEDAIKLHELFLGLPPADLLFLQRDVTDVHELAAWVEDLEQGNTITLLAEAEGTLFGEATLHRSAVPWTRHVASVRVITASMQRGRGLGRLLLEEIAQVAAERGIEKLVAEMTVEQVAARRLFDTFGFREEGHYRAYVKDRQGLAHDLVVMTRDQPNLTARRAARPPETVAWRCSACGHVTPAAEAPARCPDCGAPAENLSETEGTASS